MNNIKPAHIIGAACTLLFFVFLGIYSGKKVKNDNDFNTGGKSSSTLLVTGTIIGTLVGGSTTIGTAQLAFTNGFSALWFSLGASLGCIFLGLIFVKPLRESECTTIQEIIRKEYGQTAGAVTSILTSVGIILNIVAQILSANALLETIFNFSPLVCTIISIFIMACYVGFGGVKGAGLLGVVKMFLLYIAVIVGGIMALKLEGGIDSYYVALPHSQFFNLFGRGIGIDGGAGLSVLLGVLSTQSYVQAVLSGKTNKEAKRGAFISALLIPPIGLFSALIGMYMRINSPTVNAGQAFPQFALDHIPPLFAGIVLATLLIAVIGTGSGMALGFGTIFTNDIYKRFINKEPDSRTSLKVTRIVILISLIVSAAFTYGNLKTGILKWGFMSMGLRAVVLFFPMCTALFYKNKIHKNFVIASSFFGLIAMIIGSFLNLPFDSLFLGMIVSLIIMVFGAILKRENNLRYTYDK